MSGIYFFLTIFLAFNAQGQGSVYYSVAQNEQSWVNEKLEWAVNGLKDYFVNVEIAKIEELAAKTRNELNLAPEDKCARHSHEMLQIAKNYSIRDFLHCREMPNILLNSKKIVSDVVGLVEFYMHVVKQMLDGLDGCTPIFSEKGLKCFNAYLWNVLDFGEVLAARTNEVVSTVRNLAGLITEEIATCKNSFISSNVNKILNEYNKCVSSK